MSTIKIFSIFTADIFIKNALRIAYPSKKLSNFAVDIKIYA